MKRHAPLERYDMFMPSSWETRARTRRTLSINDKIYLGSVYAHAETIHSHNLAKEVQIPNINNWNIDAFRVWCAAKGYQLEKF